MNDPQTPEQEIEAINGEMPVLENVANLFEQYIIAHRNAASREEYAEAKRLSEIVLQKMRGNTARKSSNVVILTCFLIIKSVWGSFLESKRAALHDAHRRSAIDRVTKH